MVQLSQCREYSLRMQYVDIQYFLMQHYNYCGEGILFLNCSLNEMISSDHTGSSTAGMITSLFSRQEGESQIQRLR